MGFFVPKKTILAPKPKKFAANFCNRGIQTVRSRTFPTSNQETQAHTEEKRSRRICRRGLLWSRAGIRSIFGNACACKLPVRYILQCRSRQALSLRTVQKVLSLRTELNSNAVSCKVCARFCCRLSLWGHGNIWFQTIIFPSYWDSSWDLRKLLLRLSV